MGCDLRLTKSKLPRWVKVLLIIGGVIVGLILIWFAIRTIFPLPLANELQITERKIVIDSYMRLRGDFPVYDGYFAVLKGGQYIYVLDTTYTENYFAQNEPKEGVSRIYLLSKDYEVIKTVDMEHGSENLFVLDNGNFTIIKSHGVEDDNVKYSVVEYTPELEFVSEKAVPEDLRFSSYYSFYNDGNYYSGISDNLHVLDENLNVLDTYRLADFPEASFIDFAVSYDGEVFLRASYDEGYHEYEFPTRYLLHPLDGGEDVEYSLAPDTMGDLFENHTGDERYAFYTKSTNLNEALMWVFLKNIRGDYIYGINKDGSFDKIGSYDWEDGNELLTDYYNGVPYNGKRYLADATDESLPLPEDFKVTVYLYEYTGTYPN
jgi:hypothetical protein